jgi:hypothetical protein
LSNRNYESRIFQPFSQQIDYLKGTDASKNPFCMLRPSIPIIAKAEIGKLRLRNVCDMGETK